MTMKVSSGWFFGALQDARRLRSELWEERSAAASAAVVAAGGDQNCSPLVTFHDQLKDLQNIYGVM